MPRHSFRYINKRVRELLQKYNVNYHCTGFIEGTKEVLDRLDRVSKSIEKDLASHHHQE